MSDVIDFQRASAPAGTDHVESAAGSGMRSRQTTEDVTWN